MERRERREGDEEEDLGNTNERYSGKVIRRHTGVECRGRSEVETERRLPSEAQSADGMVEVHDAGCAAAT